MPDETGRFKGISLPAIPWHNDKEQGDEETTTDDFPDVYALALERLRKSDERRAT